MSASLGTNSLARELNFVKDIISCPQCVKHMEEFRNNPKNLRWLTEDPEFYVYKLHTEANSRARHGGKKASFPPNYSETVRKYRAMAHKGLNVKSISFDDTV